MNREIKIEEYLMPLINDVIVHLLDNYNGRKIVAWGGNLLGVSRKLSYVLKTKYNISTAFYIDSDEAKWNGVDTFGPDKISGLSEQFYVVIPLAFHQSIKNRLCDFGYQSETDYYYFSDCIIKQDDFYYEDAHGNKLFGFHKGVSIEFRGFDSIINIGDKINFSNASISIYNNSKIDIGNDVTINDCYVRVEDYSNVKIGNGCMMSKGTLDVKNNAQFFFGDASTIGDFYFNVNDNASIEIGRDSMFALGIGVFSNDSHSIFDVKSRENINSTEEIAHTRKIIIGNHVWIGWKSTILYNTEIGDGSIIGANSLVKGIIPNNCIAAGSPAKVIRKNVSWSRDNCSDNILDCGEEYINFTEE
jgi:acetyltransferase-like isoleucine patch superfamily enzyme